MHNLTFCIAKSGWLQHSGEISVSEKKKEKRERDKQRMVRGVGSKKKKFIGKHMAVRCHKIKAKLRAIK